MATGNDADRILVGAMISLAQQLGLRVVAEGVESAETAATLTALGCDEAQGYHYARPLPAAAFGAWFVGFATTNDTTNRAA